MRRDKIIDGVRTWIPEVETPCAQEPDLYSEVGDRKNSPDTIKALKRTCATECSVVLDCLTSAMEEEAITGQYVGMRGSLTPRERRWATQQKAV